MFNVSTQYSAPLQFVMRLVYNEAHSLISSHEKLRDFTTSIHPKSNDNSSWFSDDISFRSIVEFLLMDNHSNSA